MARILAFFIFVTFSLDILGKMLQDRTYSCNSRALDNSLAKILNRVSAKMQGSHQEFQELSQ